MQRFSNFRQLGTPKKVLLVLRTAIQIYLSTRIHQARIRVHLKLEYIVINEQCTYEFELGNQSRTDATRLRMLTWAVHCTYKYVQLRHWFPFCRKVAEFMNFQWTSSTANSVMHWRIHTFLDVSAALLYTVHCNQANALILVESLVIRVCSA